MWYWSWGAITNLWSLSEVNGLVICIKDVRTLLRLIDGKYKGTVKRIFARWFAYFLVDGYFEIISWNSLVNFPQICVNKRVKLNLSLTQLIESKLSVHRKHVDNGAYPKSSFVESWNVKLFLIPLSSVIIWCWGCRESARPIPHLGAIILAWLPCHELWSCQVRQTSDLPSHGWTWVET